MQLNLSHHTIADYVKQIYHQAQRELARRTALEAQRLGLFGRGR